MADLYIIKKIIYLHETVSPVNLKDVGIVSHFDSKWGVYINSTICELFSHLEFLIVTHMCCRIYVLNIAAGSSICRDKQYSVKI